MGVKAEGLRMAKSTKQNLKLSANDRISPEIINRQRLGIYQHIHRIETRCLWPTCTNPRKYTISLSELTLIDEGVKYVSIDHVKRINKTFRFQAKHY